MKQNIHKAATVLTEGATDAGKVIEVGFTGLLLAAYPNGVPENQRRELRNAFFAGAQHLFASIMVVMDSDREPTPRDLHRMSMIHEELEAFIKGFEAENLHTDGNA